MGLLKMLDKGKKTARGQNDQVRADKAQRNAWIKSIESGRKVEKLHTEAPSCVQDAIEIYKIHPDGIFEIQPGIFSKSYYFYSGQYWLLGETERMALGDLDTQMRSSINCDIQYTHIKRPLVVDSITERLFLPDDKYPEIAQELNDVMMEKQLQVKNGMEELTLITLTVRKSSYKVARDELLAKENTLRRGMAANRSRITPIGTDERLLIFRQFYQRGNKRPFHYTFKDPRGSYSDFRNNIAPQYFSQYSRHIEIGLDTYVRMFYVAEYADELEDDIIHRILEEPFEMIVSTNHTEIPKSAVKSKGEDNIYHVERRKQKEQQNNNKNGLIFQGISYATEVSEEKARNFMRELSNEKMFFVSTTIALVASSMEELERGTNSLLSLGDEKGIRIEIHENLQREGLATALPHGARYTRTMRNLLATAAFCYHPYWSTEIMMENGIWYGNNQITHNPIMMDRRYLDNPHGLIFGSSGSTKSGMNKLRLLQIILKRMGRVIIFDPTGEYRTMCDPLGGVYIDCSLKSGVIINPLEIPKHPVNERQFVADKSQLLCNIVKEQMGNSCSSNHFSVLDRAISALYLEAMKKRRLHKKYQPILSDLEKHIRLAAQQMIQEAEEYITDSLSDLYKKTAEELCMAFSILTKGSLNFFSGESNLDIWDKDLVCVGFSDVPQNLYDIAVVVFLDYIETVAENNMAEGIVTYFDIDELHELIKSNLISEYIATRWKVGRHEGLILTGILQDITDLQEKPVCRHLLTNSATVIIMKQAPSNMGVIMRECNVTEDEARYALNCERGTGIIKFGSSVLPFDATIPPEYQHGILWSMLDTDTVRKGG